IKHHNLIPFTQRVPRSMIKNQGKTAKITCTMHGKSMGEDYVHWYLGNPGKGLQWILYNKGTKIETSPDFPRRFSAVKSGDSSILTITKVNPNDSGIYYCGVWDSHSSCRHTRDRTKTCLSLGSQHGCSWVSVYGGGEC
uniref:Ig-like domain-containing protein n=1 Tax=Callorhinchus milii TaxID=7868 RepID=A0A4W3J0P9_CALMI